MLHEIYLAIYLAKPGDFSPILLWGYDWIRIAR